MTAMLDKTQTAPAPTDWTLPDHVEKQIFLLGWPKAGTSSVYTWLADHPAVSGNSFQKETFHFVDADYPAYRLQGRSVQEDGYEMFVNYFPPDARIWLEGSTHTVYQQIAADYLGHNRDRSHGVLVLREPARRILSSFESTKNNFANASHELKWDLYVDHLLAGTVDELRPYYYDETSFSSAKRQLEFSDYAYWIRRWREILGEDHLHVVLFDEAKNDPRGFITDLATRLGLDPRPYEDYDFPSSNETIMIRNQAAHRVMKKLRPLMPQGALRQKLKSLYRSLQHDASLKEDPTLGLQKLRPYFEPKYAELEDLTGLDLSVWKKTS